MVIEFLGWSFAHALAGLMRLERDLNLRCMVGSEPREFSEALREDCLNVAITLTVNLHLLELDASTRICEVMVEDLRGPGTQPGRLVALHQRMIDIQLTIQIELQKYRFAFVEPDKAKYFQAKDPFGERVSKVFPLAVPDIRDAGNCLALGLHTASVFHLMRASEWGLRKIAKAVGLTRIGKKATPVEYSTWNTVVESIDKKLEALHKLTASKMRAKKLTHYSEMNAHIFAFKDAWRDDIMHSRKEYNEPEALNIYAHIRGFMEKAAQGVS